MLNDSDTRWSGFIIAGQVGPVPLKRPLSTHSAHYANWYHYRYEDQQDQAARDEWQTRGRAARPCL